MRKIRWGIIGCGDVTEVKSGPAFNKVKNSELVAVMRRDSEKAKDYAFRHNVPKWYSDANKLIHDPDVNAIYIATPPSSHEEYTMAAFDAGKPVYVEKPMSVDAASANRMAKAANEKKMKLVVAHYRNAQPLFNGIKQLLTQKVIGDVRFVKSELYKPSLSVPELEVPKNAWRVDPAIAGGGLFHDLAPHQFGLMNFFFGEAEKVSGISLNQGILYDADDMVAGNILFKNGVLFNGIWCFNVSSEDEKDHCRIVGEKGSIAFTFFSQREVIVNVNGKTETFTYDILQHVQQPMIEKIVEYFSEEGPNPCRGEEGALAMEWIEKFTRK
ncbi:MAG TPA: Gfo/Idh/MocA family oxidoreductase [Chitinophagaceae bacterium]|jgi:predicted dehydrogenase|nr:Gfo/Idh/MocA family oxidoreductase [Chitinophagaceae bacterium]